MIKAARATGLERLELERLRERVGRLLAALQEAALTDGPSPPGAWSPPVDLCEEKDAIIIRVELPGVRAEQIKIGLTNTQLRVCGEKKKRVPRNRVISHLCSERIYGHFSRIVPLRWPINVREATAELISGVLVVRLPKQKDRRGSEFKVPIKEGKESDEL
jgi:HSP20 family protein